MALGKKHTLALELKIQLNETLRETLEVLKAERESAIGIRTDEILETSVKKTACQQKIKLLHERILAFTSGAPAPIGHEEWDRTESAFRFLWAQVEKQGRSNQEFLKLSLSHLGRLADNLKTLLGNHSVYSARGEKVDSTSTGQVLEVQL